MLCILWVVSSKDRFQEKISFFGLKFGQKWPFWANFGGFWAIKSPNKVRLGYFLDMLCILRVVMRKVGFQENFLFLDRNLAKTGHFGPILGVFGP